MDLSESSSLSPLEQILVAAINLEANSEFYNAHPKMKICTNNITNPLKVRKSVNKINQSICIRHSVSNEQK